MNPSDLIKGKRYKFEVPGNPTEILEYDFEQISGYAFLTTILSKNKTVIISHSAVKHFMTEI